MEMSIAPASDARLSEDELVAYLKASVPDITKRRVSSWRAKRLLPPFDVPGGGGGRGHGRRASYWSQGERVTRQAVAVHEALSFHPRVEDAYWPLWLFGYEIDIEIARAKLLEEIALARQALAEGKGSRESLDDYFFDKAFDLYAALQDYDGEPLREVTFDQIELFVQAIANPVYRPDDPLSEEWQFVRQHFLLPVLEETVRNLPVNELRRLQQDYCHFIDGVRFLANVVDFPAEFPQKYCLAGNVGVFFVLFDLAFRRAGYGDFIDRHLPRVQEYLQQTLEMRATATPSDTTGRSTYPTLRGGDTAERSDV